MISWDENFLRDNFQSAVANNRDVDNIYESIVREFEHYLFVFLLLVLYIEILDVYAFTVCLYHYNHKKQIISVPWVVKLFGKMLFRDCIVADCFFVSEFIGLV